MFMLKLLQTLWLKKKAKRGLVFEEKIIGFKIYLKFKLELKIVNKTESI